MKYVLSIAAILLLSGCSESGAVKDAITERLKDPGSAEFGDISVVDGAGGKYACATVNARNSFGGYTGEQQITLQHMGEAGWMWVGDATESSHESCVRIITTMANNDNAEAEAEQAARDAAAAGAEAAAVVDDPEPIASDTAPTGSDTIAPVTDQQKP